MVKANSLLYAIYVCLIVGLLCGAMLYMASLYTQLNSYYVSRQDLYIHNQSLVNFALANIDTPDALPNDGSGIVSSYQFKTYGIIPMLVASSIINNDTITSAHFIGSTPSKSVALYLPHQAQGIYYAGKVNFLGDCYLPSQYISAMYIENKTNNLQHTGSISISSDTMPRPAESIVKGQVGIAGKQVTLNDIPKEGQQYFNSFLQPTLVLSGENRISGVNIRGNLVIESPEPITILASAHLEDVIIKAPSITFEDNFEGSVQAFAKDAIHVGKNVKLAYPSVLYMSSFSDSKCTISIGEGSSIAGLVLLYGNKFERADYNLIEIEKDVTVLCDIYCTGTTALKSNINGSVYTNKLLYKGLTASYGNCLADVDVGPGNRPKYFINIPLFKNTFYGAVKKLI